MTTSSQLPLCVYCGTERPADRSDCPKCGRPWIDVRVGSLAETEAEARVLVGAAITAEVPPSPIPTAESPETILDVDLTDDDDEPDDTTATMPSWAIPAVLAVSALLVIAMFGFGLLDGGGNGDAAPASTTAATTPATTAEATTTAPTTTVPATTTAPTTTLPAPGSLSATGDPIAVAALELHADGVGPVEIGSGAAEAIGRLVASLGKPEAITAAGPEHGLCEGDQGRVVRWAGLSAIVRGTIESGTFVAYRYQHPDVPVSHLDLATPSGIHIGDTLDTVNEVYASYDISYETDGTTATFTLSDGEQLLLWGPVTTTEGTGQVEGIFSALPCRAP